MSTKTLKTMQKTGVRTVTLRSPLPVTFVASSPVAAACRIRRCHFRAGGDVDSIEAGIGGTP